MRFADINSCTKSAREWHEDFPFASSHREQRNSPGKFDIADRAHGSRGARFPYFASDQIADVICPSPSCVRWSERQCDFRFHAIFRRFDGVKCGKMKSPGLHDSSIASIARRQGRRGALRPSASHTSRKVGKQFGKNMSISAALRRESRARSFSRQGNPGERFALRYSRIQA